MLKARAMRVKPWSSRVVGVLAVLAVALAGLWSLSVATAFADEPAAAKPAAAKPVAKTTDDLPGSYQLPLRGKAADPGAVTPATFTVSGKKFLEGRPLKAGEFTFVMRAAGAYKVPGGSTLAKQLQSDSLSAAEKYELVAHGGLPFHPHALQPEPDPSTVTNGADGAVAFGPLTFEGKTLGETATGRHLGTVFCYTVSEQPPRDADGQLLDGVTKDKYGRYVYQGVTYDDCVKRVYLYAYEKVGADRSSKVVVVPLGDATFDDPPVRAQAGIGAGFRNSFGGAYLDSYDGAVYLEGQPIARGEFKFDVHEVAEDGSLLGDQQVPCGAAGGGLRGAEVPVIDGKAFDKPGRFFFAVSQSAPAKSVEDEVQLDETSYVVTVEVTATDQQGLDAQITYVRKKAADSNQWVDVKLSTKPSPIIWENKLAKEQPDEPSAPEGPGDAGADKPDTPGNPDAPDTPDSPTNPDSPDAPGVPGGSEGTDKPGGSDSAGGSGETAPGQGTEGGAGEGADKPDGDGTVVKPEPGHDGDQADGRPQGGQGSDQAPQTIGGHGSKQDEATTVTKGDDRDKAAGAFAQTGDSLIVGIGILIVCVVAAIIALIIAGKRRK